MYYIHCFVFRYISCNIYANQVIKLIDFKSGSYDWWARIVVLMLSKKMNLIQFFGFFVWTGLD